MRKFLLKLLLLFLPILLVALGCEFYITKQVNAGKRYYFQADWHDLKNHNSDVLFVGNSRTWVHVDPFAIQNRFHIKCEVIAQDGQGAQILWLKFKQYVNNNKTPREIYLQFDPWSV